jgi:DNA-binding MarR family transcriptional regulator
MARTRIRRRSEQVAAPGGKAAEPAQIALGMLPDLVGYHVRLAQMAIFADFETTLVELALSPGLFGLLVIIEANPGLKQTQLADAARLDRSTLVPALDKLEDRGLVERRAAPGDRRSNGLFLTDAGARLLAEAKRAVLRHEARLAREFAAGERDKLLALLTRIFPEHR